MARITDEQRYNRQWNFYVIRELWKINKKQTPDLYTDFGISKRKYTALITGDTGTEPQMKKKSVDLCYKTGADKSVFTGDKRLSICDISESDKFPDGINDDMITDYLKALDQKRFLLYDIMQAAQTDQTEEKEHLEVLEKKITDFRKFVTQSLRKADYSECADSDLRNIEYYIRNENKYDDTVTIERVMSYMKHIGIAELTTAYEKKSLDAYIKKLKEQTALANAVKIYKKHQ